MTNWRSTLLLEASEMGSLVFSTALQRVENKNCMLVIWVLSAMAAAVVVVVAVKHHPVLTEGCLVSGSALRPAVCLSLSKCVQGAEHHASTE